MLKFYFKVQQAYWLFNISRTYLFFNLAENTTFRFFWHEKKKHALSLL